MQIIKECQLLNHQYKLCLTLLHVSGLVTLCLNASLIRIRGSYQQTTALSAMPSASMPRRCLVSAVETACAETSVSYRLLLTECLPHRKCWSSNYSAPSIMSDKYLRHVRHSREVYLDFNSLSWKVDINFWNSLLLSTFFIN